MSKLITFDYLICGLVGRKGSGKSFLLMHQILTELVNGDMNVVVTSNLKIDWFEVEKYLEKNPPKASRRTLSERLFFLDPSDVPQFFRFRGGWELDSVSDERYMRAHERPDVSKCKNHPPCFFVVDEAQDSISQGDLHGCRKQLFWYLTKIRHFRDRVLWTSQRPDFVSVDLRDNTDTWWKARNFSQHKFNKFFTSGGGHRVDVYDHQPSMHFDFWNRRIEDRAFPLDLSIARCYETATVGAVKGSREHGLVRGFSPMWIFVGIVVLMVGGWFALTQGTKLVAKRLGSGVVPDMGKPSKNALARKGGGGGVGAPNPAPIHQETQWRATSLERKPSVPVKRFIGVPALDKLSLESETEYRRQSGTVCGSPIFQTEVLRVYFEPTSETFWEWRSENNKLTRRK